MISKFLVKIIVKSGGNVKKKFLYQNCFFTEFSKSNALVSNSAFLKTYILPASKNVNIIKFYICKKSPLYIRLC